jgi:hypothetical protein
MHVGRWKCTHKHTHTHTYHEISLLLILFRRINRGEICECGGGWRDDIEMERDLEVHNLLNETHTAGGGFEREVVSRELRVDWFSKVFRFR